MNERIDTARVEEGLAAASADLMRRAASGDMDQRAAQFVVDAMTVYERSFCKAINDGATSDDMRDARMTVLGLFLEGLVRDVAADLGEPQDAICASAFSQLYDHVVDALHTRSNEEIDQVMIRGDRQH